MSQSAANDVNSNILSKFLNGYTAEVTSGDKKSLVAAKKMMRQGSEIFVASLPRDTIEKQVAAAVQIHKDGFKAVPHIVARNIHDLAALESIIERMVSDAKVDTALVLGGDRDDAVGDFDASLQLIETGLLQKHGIRRIYLGCYPEGHPRIDDKILDEALAAKLIAAKKAGLEVELISQFCFDAQPIVDFAIRLRELGVTAPFRVGVAGPAGRATLVKYAIICGVGASLRALKERQTLAKNMIAGETPEALLRELSIAFDANPELGFSGVHFFTFGSLENSAKFVANL